MDSDIPDIRFAMEAQTGRVEAGGWAKEATAVQFPISQSIAGVSMALKPGALRELHWHANAAEWGFVFKGRCRTTIIDPQGRRETNNFGPGDIWYFPRGHGHSIQGLGPDDCHFLLVFDNGHFSEFATFSLSDWLAQTPPDVLAKNLGLPAAAFRDFPKKEVYIATGPVPPATPEQPPTGSENAPPLTHRFHLEGQAPRVYPGGLLHMASSAEFPLSTTMTGALMKLKRGGLRELHWHPNADEWQYYISGRARMTVFGSRGRARTAEYGPGDVGFAPQGYGHYIENIGADECRLLIVFNSGTYEEISLSEWLLSNPRALVAQNFGVPEGLVSKLPAKQVFISG